MSTCQQLSGINHIQTIPHSDKVNKVLPKPPNRRGWCDIVQKKTCRSLAAPTGWIATGRGALIAPRPVYLKYLLYLPARILGPLSGAKERGEHAEVENSRHQRQQANDGDDDATHTMHDQQAQGYENDACHDAGDSASRGCHKFHEGVHFISPIFELGISC